jgi:hypothetical protein
MPRLSQKKIEHTVDQTHDGVVSSYTALEWNGAKPIAAHDTPLTGFGEIVR